MITRLLVANRGEIACRIFRTAEAMGITCVAVYGEPDRDALHVQHADLAVPLAGSTAAETYLSSVAILNAAVRSGADAIHPGYGFLSENAEFAQAVIDAGLIWVGPSPDAITRMGDKLTAKGLMAAAGVPVLPSTTDLSVAHTIGFPVIVKAAAGGGGKGMRIVAAPEDLEEATAAARRQAASAFGDDRVFIERFVERPRHIEVQVFGDTHGNIVHIGDRECSVQRRHQKVIEEAPSPAVDSRTRDRLGQAAVAAARAVDYVGAGTVEFVATQPRDDAGPEFFFLEMNTRLQVEHPVTELAWRVRGDDAPLDLVRLQLLVAGGAPLPFEQDDLVLGAYAVEARLYAEDPAAGFLPATGTIELLDPAGHPGTRWDTGVGTGDTVSPYFDPMLAKVIASAPTRAEALRTLATELRDTRLYGLKTNRAALVGMLTHPEMRSGELDTSFIDRLAPEVLDPPTEADVLLTHLVAATLVGHHRRAAARTVQQTVPAGWRNNRSQSPHVAFDLDVAAHAALDGQDEPAPVDVRYRPLPGRRWAVEVSGTGRDPVDVEVVAVGEDEIDMVLDGLRLRVRVVVLSTAADGSVVWGADSVLGSTRLPEHPRFPRPQPEEGSGGLGAPMPGTVLSVAVSIGDRVEAGDVVMVLEAMKMEHRILAPTDGTVSEVAAATGDAVQAQDILAVIEPDDD